MMSDDSSKIDEALEVVKVAQSEVYHIGESEYVRKTDLHEGQKET
jgi:hypothetical protein